MLISGWLLLVVFVVTLCDLLTLCVGVWASLLLYNEVLGEWLCKRKCKYFWVMYHLTGLPTFRRSSYCKTVFFYVVFWLRKWSYYKKLVLGDVFVQLAQKNCVGRRSWDAAHDQLSLFTTFAMSLRSRPRGGVSDRSYISNPGGKRRDNAVPGCLFAASD